MLALQGFLVFLPSLGFVAAHKHPQSAQEREVQRALQAAAYHCAPAVESFTRSRKQAFSQQYNHPSIPGVPLATFLDQQLLFSADANSVDNFPKTEQTYMECMPISETHIQNNTCILAPEATEGPYYHIEGHPIRRNIAEYQDGLLLLLDIGVIDVETCKPLSNVLVDIWQANATGSYAGHPVPHPHLKDEKPYTEGPRKGLRSPFPRTKEEETWLRGAWPTDRNGVAQFTTIYPGYYSGRATHIHAKVFTEWSLIPPSSRDNPGQPEHTFFHASRLSHAGQFFFADDLNIVVDHMYPYINNPIRETYGRTRNLHDSLNIFNESHGPEGKYDPVFKTHLIGGVIQQGLVSFITMGINKSASYENELKD